MAPIILPHSPLYNLIPLQEADDVRRFMLKAITVSHEEENYGRFMSYAYAGCAITLSLVNSVGFYLRSNVRLITAILYITSTDRQQLFNNVIEDLSAACKCLIFTAVATAYVFASLIAPGQFSFKDPVPAPPPPLPPPIHPSQALVFAGRPDPKFLAVVAPLLYGRQPSLTIENWIRVEHPDGPIMVNVADPSLHRMVAAMDHRPALSILDFREVAIVHGLSTFYINPDILRGPQDQVIRKLLACFERQLQRALPAPEEPVEDLSLSSSWVLPSEEDVLAAAHLALKMKAVSWTERLQRLFLRQDHITKKMKYREFVKQMRQRLSSTLNIPEIRAFIEKPKNACSLTTAALKLCTALYESPSADERRTYQAMVDALYEAWASPEYQNEKETHPLCVALFREAFRLRYTLDFGSFFDELVTFASGPLPVKLTLANAWEVFAFKNDLSHQLDPAKGGIAGIDQYGQMLSGEIGIAFNPSRDTNTPNRNAILVTAHGEIDLLRHSTPIYQSGASAPARAALEVVEKIPGIGDPDEDGFFDKILISPLDTLSNQDTVVTGDFLGFRESAAAAEEPILHIVSEAKTKGQERSRWRARIALEGDFFFPVAFAMDGSFFNGERGFKHIQTFGELRATLVERLLGGKGNFYLSPKIAPDVDTLNMLFAEVHATFFGGREHIDRSEECDEYKTYLLFCYAYLTLHLMQIHHIRYLDGGCKDFLDRGGVFAAVLSMLILVLLNRENDPDALKAVLNNLWAPPLIVKKKGVLNERAELFKYALHLLNHTDLAGFKEGRFNGWLQDFRVPLIKDQGIHPSGTTAMVQEEYDQFIERLRKLEHDELEFLSLKRGFLNELSLLSQATILHQVTRDHLHLQVDVGNGEFVPVENANILGEALIQAGIPQDSLFRVLSGCHQGIATGVFSELQKRFNHEGLGIQLLPDNAKVENLKIFVRVRKEQGVAVASIHMEQIYQLTHMNGIIHAPRKLIGTTTVFDHHIGDAEIRCGVLPPSHE